MTVLFTCAGRRNYLLQYFKEIIGDMGKIIAVDQDATAPALAEADIALTVPSLYDKNYISTLLKILQKHKVDLVIPLNDLELPILAAHKNRLERFGAKVIISPPEVIALCADKFETYNFFRKLHIATPHSFLGMDVTLRALAEKRIQFPIILKPRWGFGSVGIYVVETEEALRLAHQLLLTQMDSNLMDSADGKAPSDRIIFQEKIVGEEYGIDIINDFNGNYYGSYARKKLAMRAGETDRAQSVIDDRFNQVAEKIAKATRHIGIMDCDFFLSDGKVYFLEMNPRFGGGYPFSHEAGLNLPGIYMEWLKEKSDTSRYDNYVAECIFSKYERILRITDCNQANHSQIPLAI